ncbi:diguanylate cyclase [Actinotalea sp. M2MS4P-6]|uniref:diguanylate cyclase n=1 Tax=Actinotalea sp. M2MS4P-6 TaxID=2983762 RepID=UPI0021E3D094|nr:diguanylate cyclase [Actinotalea sp. M2MS4P-6]MCV2395389.1 diguanylate cyclase [Actinotalea sp. M2MS4P-6]
MPELDRVDRPAVDPSAVLEAMAEGMYVVDPDRRITFWNAAAERISGYSAETALGRWCGDGLLNHVDEAGESLCGARCPLLATMTDGEQRTVRVYLHHEHGHVLPVRVTASALRDDDGKVIGAVETFTDDSPATAAEQKLRTAERLAMTDPLTGLGNRRFLEHRAAERLGSTRGEHPAALIMVDLDHFKSLNDTCGHAAGDDALTAVARTLVSVVRAEDDVIRYGGDEFVVLLGPVTPTDLVAMAARIRAAVGQTRLRGATTPARLTASIGAALGRPGDTAESLIRRADVAMLAAKGNGRNTYVVAPED